MTLLSELEELNRRTRDLGQAIRNELHDIKMYWRQKSEKMWMWVAAHLPGRLLYFACLQALGRVSQTKKYQLLPPQMITAHDVIKELEKAYE